MGSLIKCSRRSMTQRKYRRKMLRHCGRKKKMFVQHFFELRIMNINRDHLLIKDYLHTEFVASLAKRSWDMHKLWETGTAFHFDLLTKIWIGITYVPSLNVICRGKAFWSRLHGGASVFMSSPVYQWPPTRLECVSSLSLTAVLYIFLTK